MTAARELLFVSTRFLFPVDSGGKIRTTQILRGLKRGPFRTKLLSPATPEELTQHAKDLPMVCDEFLPWPAPLRGPLFQYTRLRHLFSALPIPVRTDRHAAGISLMRQSLAIKPAVAVFDFVHGAVLAPERLEVPSVMFTHNVEAEIFRRHRDVASNPITRIIWNDQYAKMRTFEQRELKRFDVVVAVAERDAAQFARDYGIDNAVVIPTGVDLDFFAYRVPDRPRDVVFCGSMDWMANQEGIGWFLDEVWAKVVAEMPDARMTVVGRAPPGQLVDKAKRCGFNWHFTGFVDDVRPYMQGSAVSVIPLRVGGGTRLKVYESMAMGSAIVSTTIGVEGLPVEAGRHYLRADAPADFAAAILQLLRDEESRQDMAREARDFVERNFSYTVAARAFQDACELAIERHARKGFQ